MAEQHEAKQRGDTDTDISIIIRQDDMVKEVLITHQRLIVTTEDKISNCLSKHSKRLEKKNAWIAPCTLLFTIVVTFATTTFKDFLLGAATWEAAFILAGVGVLIWLAIDLRAAWQSGKLGRVDELVKMKYH